MVATHCPIKKLVLSHELRLYLHPHHNVFGVAHFERQSLAPYSHKGIVVEGRTEPFPADLPLLTALRYHPYAIPLLFLLSHHIGKGL